MLMGSIREMVAKANTSLCEGALIKVLILQTIDMSVRLTQAPQLASLFI